MFRAFNMLVSRIVAIVVLLSVIAATLGGLAINGFEEFNRRSAQYSAATQFRLTGEQINGLLFQVVMDCRGIYASKDHKESEKYAPLVLKGVARIAELAKQWQQEWEVIRDRSQPDLMPRAQAALVEFEKYRTEIVRLSRESTLEAATVLGFSDEGRAARNELQAAVEALGADNAARIEKLRVDTMNFYRLRLNLLLVITAVGILGSLVLAGCVVVFTITRPINRLTGAMIAISGGRTDLVVPGVNRKDEIGEMARAADVFLRRAVAVSQLTSRIIENIRQVAVAATQSSQAVSQVSDGSNLQLGSLRQSAAALEQSTQAISHVAESTQQASEGAKRTMSLSEEGIGNMHRMVQLVTAIAENSAQVRHIADSISRIANQTNMLSLNAAIEAARAGEQGRGFAVVAEEVGKLAQSSRGLAEDITNTVRQATDDAERGLSMAREVAASMESIARGVADGDKLIAAIATAMEEQQLVVSNVNRSVGELTRIGQSNASAAEEITATMLDLSRLADTTRVTVDEFLRQAA